MIIVNPMNLRIILLMRSIGFKYACMQGGPEVENVRLLFSFWAHMLLSGLKNNYADEATLSGPVHHGYIKNHI